MFNNTIVYTPQTSGLLSQNGVVVHIFRALLIRLDHSTQATVYSSTLLLLAAGVASMSHCVVACSVLCCPL